MQEGRRMRVGVAAAALTSPLWLAFACSTVLGLEEAKDRSADAGPAGTSGASGNAGSAGSAGSGATSGSGGSAGMSGVAGTAGASGSAATAGSAGVSGTAGSAGSAGVSGGSSHPSCQGSSVSCQGESCCASPLVPGCTSCAFPSGHQSTLADYELDKYEVTVSRFRSYVSAYAGPPAASTGEHPGSPGSGWQSAWDGMLPSSSSVFATSMADRDTASYCNSTGTWTNGAGANEDKPINCVSWYEALAFCIWDGGYLPSELEWQYAAAGGSEARTYPWGNTAIDPSFAIYGYCNGGVSTVCDLSAILAAGSKPAGAGKWGHLDLSGSMWEWILDFSDNPFPVADPCDGCWNDTTAGSRMIRGGGWPEAATLQTSEFRGSTDVPTSFWKNVGIRCARPPG